MPTTRPASSPTATTAESGLLTKPANGSVTLASLIAPVTPSNLEFKITKPQVTSTSHYENYADCVSCQGGGDGAAALCCIGMPINSSQ